MLFYVTNRVIDDKRYILILPSFGVEDYPSDMPFMTRKEAMKAATIFLRSIADDKAYVYIINVDSKQSYVVRKTCGNNCVFVVNQVNYKTTKFS